MELSTHFMTGVAVGFLFFGRPEIAFIVGIGALLPDLDREYWFIPSRAYQDEQYHRALFHNVFIMALLYLASPFLALGAFVHVFQDSFTLVKDRGCEWLFPFTRIVKRGLYDSDGKPRPLDPKEKVYFYQEDPLGLLEYADPDLKEQKPVPWRRVYGMAQNGGLLDLGFFFGSIALLIIWFAIPGDAMLTWSYVSSNYAFVLAGVGSLAVLFLAGEMDRRDRSGPKSKYAKFPVFAVGLGLFAYWIYLFRGEILTNILALFSNTIPMVAGIIAIPTIALALIRLQTRKGKPPATV